MTRRLRWRLVCLCLVGLGFLTSGYLLFRTFGLLSDSGTREADACSAVFGTGCDAALLSPRAWQMGIPLAGWGVVYFSALGAMLILGGTLGAAFEFESSTGALLFSLGGGLVSLDLLGVLALGKTPLCPLCIVIHVTNLMLIPSLKKLNGCSIGRLVGALRAGGRYLLGKDNHAPLGSWKLLGFITSAMVAVIAYQWVYVEAQLRRSAAYDTAAAVQVLKEYSSTAALTIPLSGREPHRGPRQAPVKMIVFSDFQCPGCRRLAETLKSVSRMFNDKLEIVFKNYPLSSDCNPHIKGNVHPQACAAARAAMAAHLQNRFWEFHDVLFQQFDNLDESRLRQVARRIGLDVDRFDSDRQSETTAAAVQADIALGARVGVNATPTVFIDGRQVVRSSRAGLALVIYHELSIATQRRTAAPPARTTRPK